MHTNKSSWFCCIAALVIAEPPVPSCIFLGPSKDPSLKYEWAIIVGGSRVPSEPTAAGCAPSAAADEGLWLFHRKSVAPAADVETMRETAKSKWGGGG